MTQRDVRAYLQDVREAASSIGVIVQGIDLETYLRDRPIRAAVEREFTIIGEALNHILRQEPLLVDRITAAQDIIDFRNLLVHGYFLIADATVWGIVQGHLPVLQTEIEAVMKEREQAP